MNTTPTRNLALELVRVTEAAALAAGRQMGRGDRIKVDQYAVDAMREVLNTVEMDGVVVIGEGEKDEAPMLFNGESIGTGDPPKVDIAVDPIDGTRPLAHGLPNSISVVALAPRGTMYNPGPCVYMDKIATGPEAKDAIDINAPVIANLEKVARAKGEKVEDLLVVILDRPRHEELIRQVRACGARISLIQDGDVNGAIMTAWGPSGVDLMMGVGGSPEAVIAACALRAMGGNMQAKLWPRNPEEAELCRGQGYDLDQVLTLDDLVSSDDIFFAATGVTSGDLLKGVNYQAHGGAYTQSISMRGLTGTIRLIESHHSLDKLQKISRIPYV